MTFFPFLDKIQTECIAVDGKEDLEDILRWQASQFVFSLISVSKN